MHVVVGSATELQNLAASVSVCLSSAIKTCVTPQRLHSVAANSKHGMLLQAKNVQVVDRETL